MGPVRTVAVLAAAAAASSLAGCSGKNAKAGLNCPAVIGAPGADTIAQFGPGGHEAKDVAVGAKIYSINAVCAREKVGVAVNAQIEFYAQRADLAIKSTTLPYFVAVVDPQQHVLSEESFQLSLPFPVAEYYRRSLPEKITIHLPVRDQAQASAYTVVVGFQLTPDQLAFNRATHPQ